MRRSINIDRHEFTHSHAKSTAAADFNRDKHVGPNDLSREQVTAIVAATRPTLRYLNKLLKRMQQRYFPNGHPVWMATLEAQRATRKLLHELELAERTVKTVSLRITDVDRSRYRLGRPKRETH